MTKQKAAKAAAEGTASEDVLRSGVFLKSQQRRGGWGLVLLDLWKPPRVLPLGDGVVVGSASRAAHLDGAGVAPEHARISVRSDGCYFEDLGSEGGTFVSGVRAQRIDVRHGDVVRFGQSLALFVERDLPLYDGPIARAGEIVHGRKQEQDWIEPALELVRRGSSVFIEGGPGAGKAALANVLAKAREQAGEVVTVDARQGDVAVSEADVARAPSTWIVLGVDRLARPTQLSIAHAVAKTKGAIIVATSRAPLDHAAADGLVAPWFAALFTGKRVAVPLLEARREDLPAIIREIARRHGIVQDEVAGAARFPVDLLEALVRAGWPGGVPHLERILIEAHEASGGGKLALATVVPKLERAAPVKPAPTPATDPGLARARLADALGRAKGSIAATARTLGMSRQAIYREAERLGIDLSRRKR